MCKKIAAMAFALAWLGSAAAQGYAKGTTAVERAQLPTYCYPQYVDEKLRDQPGYSIPRSCGAWMNHLCPGLVHLIRAQKTTDPPQTRRTNAQQAIAQFTYTLTHMEVGCPLRAEVENAKARATTISNSLK